MFLDAIREMRKYSDSEDGRDHQHLDHEMQTNMRLFRAQRNFYISGFALFLFLVIRRLVTLISTSAVLQAQSEASLKQAQSASVAAKSLMKGDGVKLNDEKDDELKKKVAKLESEIEKLEKDKSAMKSQADNLAKEYDRLCEEHAKVQKKITAEGGDKKGD